LFVGFIDAAKKYNDKKSSFKTTSLQDALIYNFFHAKAPRSKAQSFFFAPLLPLRLCVKFLNLKHSKNECHEKIHPLFNPPFFLHHLNAQGFKWTRDGGSYYTNDAGDIVKNDLPSFAKTVVVAKALLKPHPDSNALNVRDFSFSADDKKILIYTNTKRVWRQDSRGDYWVLDLADKKLQKLGKGKPASSMMFAKFSPDGKKVAYVSEFNIYVEDIASGKITRSQRAAHANSSTELSTGPMKKNLVASMVFAGARIVKRSLTGRSMQRM
jgi:Tol biopolymer transport system component